MNEEQELVDTQPSWVSIFVATGVLIYSYTLELMILQALGGFVTLIYLASFAGDIKLSAGLSSSHLTPPSARTLAFIFAYSCVILSLWTVYPIWAAVLTPWLVKAMITNTLSALVQWEILEIRDADDDE